MFKVQTLNKISTKGIELLQEASYEVSETVRDPDAILVRSFKMKEMDIPKSVKAIARAGAGVNNIPVDRCSEEGIVVFNTPGANANSVKELVLSGLFLCARNLPRALRWVKGLSGDGEEIQKQIEQGKSNFTGPEIRGKKLGVIGLGAIGVMVANDAEKLGMSVTGFDPFISVEAAWGLSSAVKRAASLEAVLSDSDYITLHVPLNDKTVNLINQETLSMTKKGVRILNFARGGLVNTIDLIKAIREGKVACFVTDFPDADLLPLEEVVSIPHLGASTPEAEENCAVMAARQVRNFLERGTIKNSVNFPDCDVEMTGYTRILVANRNILSIVGQVTGILAENEINIADLLNRHRGEYAFNIIDVEGPVPIDVQNRLKAIDGILMVRIIEKHEK